MTDFVVKYREFCEKNNIQIKSHQVYGVIWCLKQECKPLLTEKVIAGGILADEMGMGKTIQMIGLWMMNPQEKTLLIVPPILIPQWHREIQKYTGHSACIYYGKDRAHRAANISNTMVVITSYDTFWRDFSEGQGKGKAEGQEIVWDRIVCDEAHHLRNTKTKVYQALFSVLRKNVSNKKTILWCLSGTPVQNSLSDLYSLFALFYLTENKRRIAKEFPEELRDCFLQRKQNLLIEKREVEKVVEWNKSEEREIAKDIHQTIPFLGYSLEDGVGPEDGWWARKKAPILVSMIRAKQTCILSKMIESTYLSIPTLPTLPVREEMPEKIKTMFENTYSSKLRELLSLLESRKNNGNGKILFCHYRLEIHSLLTLLMPIMNTEKSWVGEWRDYKRRSLISDNNNGDWLGESPILILPIQSGCEGLNLQKHFSEIYFVSPNWNPAIEAQAIARCHRIGQVKPVSVFRFSMNMIDTPENNREREHHIRKYLWMTDRLSDDVLRYIDEFIGADIPAISNASLDQYIFKIQRDKQAKIKKGMQYFLE